MDSDTKNTAIISTIIISQKEMYDNKMKLRADDRALQNYVIDLFRGNPDAKDGAGNPAPIQPVVRDDEVDIAIFDQMVAVIESLYINQEDSYYGHFEFFKNYVLDYERGVMRGGDYVVKEHAMLYRQNIVILFWDVYLTLKGHSEKRIIAKRDEEDRILSQMSDMVAKTFNKSDVRQDVEHLTTLEARGQLDDGSVPAPKNLDRNVMA
jgi:uncharacterized protein YifE (UPF0438 family)